MTTCVHATLYVHLYVCDYHRGSIEVPTLRCGYRIPSMFALLFHMSLWSHSLRNYGNKGEQLDLPSLFALTLIIEIHRDIAV